ncbi:MAG: ATP-dependent sacrificial sulfur transferase LarE [Planctomycetota bacterium]|nr:ATP-dependent sacrificial sulfur transferase LarE [Planctomycetota bacterium]
MDPLFDELKRRVALLESVVVAYSGGVDSALLLKVCHDVLGKRCLGVIANSESIPDEDVAEARRIAAGFGATLRVIRTREMDRPEYTNNPVNRCYFCKTDLFEALEELSEQEGYRHVAYGETLDDVGDHRPGAIAAAEHRVCSPLREAGLRKADVRRYSRALGLSTHDKPAAPCLSSRIPYGQKVTGEKLARIAEAEAYLKSRGFREVRVRHHEGLARVEIPEHEMGRIFRDGEREALVSSLLKAGFHYVTLDLSGFRSGSLNEVVGLQKPKG